MSNQSITSKGPGDLWHESEDVEGNAFDAFVSRLEADDSQWVRELIEDFLCDGTGLLADVCDRDEVLRDATAYLPLYLIPDRKYTARDARGREMRESTLFGKPLYRVDMADLNSYMAADCIHNAVASKSCQRDTRPLEKLMRDVAVASMHRWFEDDDNIKKLMAAEAKS